jgi:hypothetical protein
VQWAAGTCHDGEDTHCNPRAGPRIWQARSSSIRPTVKPLAAKCPSGLRADRRGFLFSARHAEVRRHGATKSVTAKPHQSKTKNKVCHREARPQSKTKNKVCHREARVCHREAKSVFNCSNRRSIAGCCLYAKSRSRSVNARSLLTIGKIPSHRASSSSRSISILCFNSNLSFSSLTYRVFSPGRPRRSCR